MSRESGLPRWFNPGITWAARWRYGLRPEGLDPIAFVGRWSDRPLLLIHGQDDPVVPIGQARELERAAGGSCRLVTRQGAGHVEAYDKDPAGYLREVGEFFERHLGRPQAGRGAGAGPSRDADR